MTNDTIMMGKIWHLMPTAKFKTSYMAQLDKFQALAEIFILDLLLGGTTKGKIRPWPNDKALSRS